MFVRTSTGITRNYPNKNITLGLPRLFSSEVHPWLSAMLQIRLELLLNLPVSTLLILFSILKRELICSFRKALSCRVKSVSVNKEQTLKSLILGFKSWPCTLPLMLPPSQRTKWEDSHGDRARGHNTQSSLGKLKAPEQNSDAAITLKTQEQKVSEDQ